MICVCGTAIVADGLSLAAHASIRCFPVSQNPWQTANEEQRKVLEQEQMSKKLAKAEADEAADKIRISRK